MKFLNMQQDKDIKFDEWMAAFLAGTITDEDKMKLFLLVKTSDKYKSMFDEQVKLDSLLRLPIFELQKQSDYQKLSKQLSFVDEMEYRSIRKMWLFYLRNAVAILLVVVTISAGSIYIYRSFMQGHTQNFCSMTVPLGSQTEVELPDGSTVVLNSGSILKYPLSYGKKDRTVYLKGEGYFKVEKNVEKIFTVHAEALQVKVTGTEFNVRSYSNAHLTEVSLVNGGVDVYAGKQYVHLKPNEKAVYDRDNEQLHSEETDAYKSTLWTTGRLSFIETSFVDILKDIERKFNVKIRIESQKARNEYFSGSIDLNMPLQQVFNFIDVDDKYRFEYSDGIIILKDK